MKVTLKHNTPLRLPNGQELRPNVSTEVARWDILKNHNVVKAWISAGLIKTNGEGTKAQPAANAAVGDSSLSTATQPEGDLSSPSGEGSEADDGVEGDEGEAGGEVAELSDEEKAEAKELGIKIVWNSNPATIRERIAEAKSA